MSDDHSYNAETAATPDSPAPPLYIAESIPETPIVQMYTSSVTGMC